MQKTQVFRLPSLSGRGAGGEGQLFGSSAIYLVCQCHSIVVVLWLGRDQVMKQRVKFDRESVQKFVACFKMNRILGLPILTR